MTTPNSAGTNQWLPVAAAAVVLSWFALRDWNAAPEVPLAHGLGAVSFLRAAAFALDLALLVAVLSRAFGTDSWNVMAQFSSAGRLLLCTAALAIGFGLESSGKLRQFAIAAIGKVPGGLTRLQTHQRAVDQLRSQARAAMGEPQPASFFVGRWYPERKGLRHDVRHLEIRASGEQLLARAWTDCGKPAEGCRTPETVARAERTADGRIASLQFAGPNAAGRYWVQLAPGRYASQPVFMSTHVLLEADPAWQVSSGPWVSAKRERDPVALAEYEGEWRRASPPGAGDFTRLAVRRIDAGRLALSVSIQCSPTAECDLGEVQARLEVDAQGRASSVRAEFARENRQLIVTLEPARAGVLDATSEVATISYSTVRTRRGTSVTQATGRKSSTRHTILRR